MAARGFSASGRFQIFSASGRVRLSALGRHDHLAVRSSKPSSFRLIDRPQNSYPVISTCQQQQHQHDAMRTLQAGRTPPRGCGPRPSCILDPGDQAERRRPLQFRNARQIIPIMTAPDMAPRRPSSVAASIAGSPSSAPYLHSDVLSVVYSADDLASAVHKLGRQLAEEYAHKKPLLLGALTGAFMFTADLARAMTPVPVGMSVDFFTASSYGASATVSGDVKLRMGSKIAPAGRHILVVEDIVDTGKTLKRVCETLATAGAASVKVVVLLNKAERRTEDIQADYCALDCPNEFVVGYGLDFDEQYRSLPYIGVLRPECYAQPRDPR